MAARDYPEEDDAVDQAEWELTPEGQELILRQNEVKRMLAQVRVADAAEDARRARGEQALAAARPDEWAEWLRLQPLMNGVIDFCADRRYAFEDFLREVGPRRSGDDQVRRVDESKPFAPGNLAWSARPPEPAPTSPYLNVEQAAAFLGVAVQTVYNNRAFIPSLPGFHKLMFDPGVLADLRGSAKWRTKRLAGQRAGRPHTT